MCIIGSRFSTGSVLGTAAVVCSILLVESRPVSAYSCGFSPPPVMAPAPGATDVPLNTRIWIRHGYYSSCDYGIDDVTSTYLLFDASSIPVSMTVTGIDDEVDCILVLTPTTPLTPDSRYDLWHCPDETCDEALTFFQTGSHTDLTPPAPTTEEATSRRRKMMCWMLGNVATATLDIEMVADERTILVADLGEMSTLDPVGHTGYVAQVTSESTFEFGRGACEIWPWTLDDDKQTTIRYGVFDLAGNFSGWSTPAPLDRPKLPITCTPTCSTGSPGSALGLLLVLLGLLGTLVWRLRREQRYQSRRM